MPELTTIELYKEDMNFSAGHYTIFSPTDREKLHGHNFSVYAAITARLNEIGMSFDYDIYKKKLRLLCKELDQCFLLPGLSPFQTLEETTNHVYVHFHNEKIPFLKKDIKILPLRNITVEELAKWFTEHLTKEQEELTAYHVTKIVIKVFSGPGQCGSAEWEAVINK